MEMNSGSNINLIIMCEIERRVLIHTDITTHVWPSKKMLALPVWRRYLKSQLCIRHPEKPCFCKQYLTCSAYSFCRLAVLPSAFSRHISPFSYNTINRNHWNSNTETSNKAKKSADHFASMFTKSNRPIPNSSDSLYPKMRDIHLSNAGVRALLANFDHCLQSVLFPTDKYFRREAFIPLAWDSCQQGLLFLAFPKPVRSVVLSYGYSWSLRLLWQGSRAFSNSEKNS